MYLKKKTGHLDRNSKLIKISIEEIVEANEIKEQKEKNEELEDRITRLERLIHKK